MKAYKLEVLIIDFDEIGRDSIVSELENTKYSNRCISPDVIKIKEYEIGEWSDDHPLNKIGVNVDEYLSVLKQ